MWYRCMLFRSWIVTLISIGASRCVTLHKSTVCREAFKPKLEVEYLDFDR